MQNTYLGRLPEELYQRINYFTVIARHAEVMEELLEKTERIYRGIRCRWICDPERLADLANPKCGMYYFHIQRVRYDFIGYVWVINCRRLEEAGDLEEYDRRNLNEWFETRYSPRYDNYRFGQTLRYMTVFHGIKD
jgi:hypothetical protein